MEHAKEYWNKRFTVEDKIWGELPSKTAQYALGLFRKNNVKSILVPGSGCVQIFDTICFFYIITIDTVELKNYLINKPLLLLAFFRNHKSHNNVSPESRRSNK